MFRIIKEEGENLMVEAQGRIDIEDYEKFVPVFDGLVQKYDKVNCVVDLTGVDSITPSAMLEEIKLSHKYKNNVGRYAMINPKPVLEELIEIASSLNYGEVKTFSNGETEAAWNWVREG